jgi:hypothetical protein
VLSADTWKVKVVPVKAAGVIRANGILDLSNVIGVETVAVFAIVTIVVES